MSDDLATKLQHRSADALAYLARYANYLDGVGSGVEAASVNRLRLDLSEVVVAVASTITRLRAEVETVLAGGREDRETIDALEGRVGELQAAVDEHTRGEWAPISGDGPNKPQGARCWLARKLMDSRLDDYEAFNVVAWHPSVTEQWDKSRASAALAETKPVEHAKAGVGE